MVTRYKIEISELTQRPDEKYFDSARIYEQTVDELDVAVLVRFVNQIVNVGVPAKEPFGVNAGPGGAANLGSGGVILKFKKRNK